jgi:GMP synthase-like glutamine amidotransferase
VASVLGARTYRGHRPEIGWFRVEATPEAPRHPVGRCLPQAFETFLWHEDSFDLPAGGVRIARSASYPQQAFCYGSALALQFHLEARRDWVGRIASRDGHRLVPGPSVQSVERIVSAPASLYAANNGLMDRLLDAWLASVAVAAR